MDVARLLANPRFKWQRRAAPPRAALDAFYAAAPKNLPVTYLRLLEACDGGSGANPFGAGDVEIWPVAEVLERNRAARVEQLWPGYFALGTAAPGGLLGFDLREPDGAPVCALEGGTPSVLAASFSEFLQSIALRGGAG
jgi:hypothetical protein